MEVSGELDSCIHAIIHSSILVFNFFLLNFYTINKIKEEIILATEFCPRDCMHEAQLQEIQIPQNISKVAHGLHGTEARGCDAHVGAARGAGVAHSGEYIALFVVHPLLQCQD